MHVVSINNHELGEILSEPLKAPSWRLLQSVILRAQPISKILLQLLWRYATQRGESSEIWGSRIVGVRLWQYSMGRRVCYSNRGVLAGWWVVVVSGVKKNVFAKMQTNSKWVARKAGCFGGRLFGHCDRSSGRFSIVSELVLMFGVSDCKWLLQQNHVLYDPSRSDVVTLGCRTAEGAGERNYWFT